VGKSLSDFWKLEEHKSGVQSFTHFADGTAHKNRVQGNDFVQSVMYTRGVTCFSLIVPEASASPAGEVAACGRRGTNTKRERPTKRLASRSPGASAPQASAGVAWRNSS
jgi:negative regulator of sigma E activity